MRNVIAGIGYLIYERDKVSADIDDLKSDVKSASTNNQIIIDGLEKRITNLELEVKRNVSKLKRVTYEYVMEDENYIPYDDKFEPKSEYDKSKFKKRKSSPGRTP